jgi:FMN reductase
VAVDLLDLLALPADALLARRKDPLVDTAITQASQAGILVLGTPIYRASYTGQLKAFLDLFPQDALFDSVVGLIATGAGSSHTLAIDHGLRPLVASLRGLTAAQAIYVTDAQLPDKTQVPEAIDRQAHALARELYVLARGLAGAGQPEA